MNKDEIVKFLDEQKDLPSRLREKITHHHTGLRPTWLVRSMQREENEIVVLGEWNRQPSAKMFIVLRWYWNEQAIGVRWQSFRKLEKAAELKISIDCVHVDLRA